MAKAIYLAKMSQSRYDIPQSQIDEINNLLLAYSEGKYKTKGEISAARDEIDTIILGVNMLGEELDSTTVSRDYFLNIYNSVGEMLLVLDNQGNVIDANQTAQDKLGIELGQDSTANIASICPVNETKFESIVRKLNRHGGHFSREEVFCSQKNKQQIPVECSYAIINEKKETYTRILLVATDITERKQTERLILKTIVETQENEQRRFSEDLHDSLGQELSTVKLLLSSFKLSAEKDSKLLKHCQNLLDSSISNLRLTCFDMMPSALKKYGLIEGISQLIRKLKFHEKIKFHFNQPSDFPIMNDELQVALYRIVQEFTNNSIKHSNCENISIDLSKEQKGIRLIMKDDGCGFDKNDVTLSNGLGNMESRAKAYNGVMKLKSKEGIGTELSLIIPM